VTGHKATALHFTFVIAFYVLYVLQIIELNWISTLYWFKIQRLANYFGLFKGQVLLYFMLHCITSTINQIYSMTIAVIVCIYLTSLLPRYTLLSICVVTKKSLPGCTAVDEFRPSRPTYEWLTHVIVLYNVLCNACVPRSKINTTASLLCIRRKINDMIP